MHAKNELIIFVKNPVKGKVKTRLAKTVGEDKALAIYHKLLKHTMEVTLLLNEDKIVYYDDFIPSNDMWKRSGYKQAQQEGDDLGQRMYHAFEQEFKKGFRSICIIGSDCLELNGDIIIHAFEKLQKVDLVIGPTKDGGYYLLGMNHFYPKLFYDKHWSTHTVYDETIHHVKEFGITHELLPVLRDIDEEDDLQTADFKYKSI